jgi:hypothetical protein
MILLAPFRIFWEFWTKPIRAESLAMFRILLGTVVLCNILTGIGQSLTFTCGPDGACPAEAADEWLQRTGKMCLLRGPVSLPVLSDWLPDWLAKDFPWLNNQLPPAWARAWTEWGAKPSSVYLLFGLFVLSLVCMTLGLGTRLATLAALLLANTFHHRLPWLMNGGDSLFRNGLYFLLLSPAGATWSLDHWLWRRWRGQTDDDPVFIAPWSVRLMQIQVCCMYLFTGLVKTSDQFDPYLIASDGWGTFFRTWLSGDYFDGQALYWVVNDIALCRWPYCRLPIPLAICRLMSWGTLAFEIGFSFFVCVPPLRKYLLLAGLGLHLGILLIMEIGWFSQVTLCWYMLFIPGEQISAFFQRLGQRWSARAAQGPLPAGNPA